MPAHWLPAVHSFAVEDGEDDLAAALLAAHGNPAARRLLMRHSRVRSWLHELLAGGPRLVPVSTLSTEPPVPPVPPVRPDMPSKLRPYLVELRETWIPLAAGQDRQAAAWAQRVLHRTALEDGRDEAVQRRSGNGY